MGLIKKLSNKASSAFNSGYRSAGGAVSGVVEQVTGRSSNSPFKNDDLAPGTYVKRKQQFVGRVPKAGREVEDAYKNPYSKSFGGPKRGGSRPAARKN
jgi:hypothetical protein